MAKWLTSWDSYLKENYKVMTDREIATHFGVSTACVQKNRNRLGLYKGRGPVAKPIDPEDLKDMLLLGMTALDIGKKYGKDARNVKELISKLGRQWTRAERTNKRRKKSLINHLYPKRKKKCKNAGASAFPKMSPTTGSGGVQEQSSIAGTD